MSIETKSARRSTSKYNFHQGYVDESGHLLDRIGHYIDLDMTICLTGPPGTGKTTLLQQLAAERGRKLHTAIASDLMPSDLIGNFRLRQSTSVYIPGKLAIAAKRGDWFYLDEVLSATSDIFNLLHGLIDHRRELYISSINKVIQAHPNFRLVLSYNPQKNGDDLPRPFRDRLTLIHVARLSRSVERRLLIERHSITKSQADYLVEFAAITREICSYSGASLRQLEQAAKAVARGVSLQDAAQECILNGICGTDDRLRRDIEGKVMASELIAHDLFVEENA